MIYRIPIKISFTDTPTREQIRDRLLGIILRDEEDNTIARAKVLTQEIKYDNWEENTSLARPAFNE